MEDMLKQILDYQELLASDIKSQWQDLKSQQVDTRNLEIQVE